MSKEIEKYYPSQLIDPIAEKESYRKEIYRPIYHMHKWWAQRLGSIFRALVLGAIAENENVEDLYYRNNDFANKIILDPFLGSGTTVGESLKVGCKAIGCDINPVSSFIVEQAFKNIDIKNLKKHFLQLENCVKEEIQQYYYKTHPLTGEKCKVLYYFWVKEIAVPNGKKIPLFSSYIFSRNAYPKKKPEVKIICPQCCKIIDGRYDSIEVICPKCGNIFNPQIGPAKGNSITDFQTGVSYTIMDLLKHSKNIPEHKMYAVMVLLPNGNKEYLEINDEDLNLYNKAKEDYLSSDIQIPNYKINPGHNTNQVLNYNYKYWSDFFNFRQLRALSLLLEAIKKIKDKDIQLQFVTLLSGTLEFNNMFCSFKGEGTGAVRHLFYNHILKPERTPIENSVWGTEKSSGTFSTLFESRLLKAKEYLNKPFELKISENQSEKIYCNNPLSPVFVKDFYSLANTPNACLILNSDSGNLSQIPSKSIDAIITDPPYFDFVHYSELSDFFYAWLKPVLENDIPYFKNDTSRRNGEVQNKSVEVFAENLSNVFKECNRTLKNEGLMVFSFHHSRGEGWSAIFKAIHSAGFYIEKTFPVKAEMSVSTTKKQAKSPINLDSLIVCKKNTIRILKPLNGYMEETISSYKVSISDFKGLNRRLSVNDKRVIFYSKLIENLSKVSDRDIDFDKIIKNTEFVEL
jgi:putative DNA methylase